MSSLYPGPPNTAKALQNKMLGQGVGTNNLPGQWIQAKFKGLHQVDSMVIAAADANMVGGWGAIFLSQRSIEYLDPKKKKNGKNFMSYRI